ncbi:MAG TPA: FAD-dependent oxidoreductase, partial [Xanthobacteraceae bacterium]|nr:FAD-dependent oxidoreductase [Xanthobacteraceae bacterium]
MHEVDVIVIGAGAAGVAAARALASGRLSVAVLEARDRIGGRAWTAHISGLPLDLGCG